MAAAMRGLGRMDGVVASLPVVLLPLTRRGA